MALQGKESRINHLVFQICRHILICIHSVFLLYKLLLAYPGVLYTWMNWLSPVTPSPWSWIYFSSSRVSHSFYTGEVKFSKESLLELRVLADLGACQGDSMPTWTSVELKLPILPNVLIFWQRWTPQLDLKGGHPFYFIRISTLWIYVPMTEGFINKQVSTCSRVN